MLCRAPLPHNRGNQAHCVRAPTDLGGRCLWAGRRISRVRGDNHPPTPPTIPLARPPATLHEPLRTYRCRAASSGPQVSAALDVRRRFRFAVLMFAKSSSLPLFTCSARTDSARQIDPSGAQIETSSGAVSRRSRTPARMRRRQIIARPWPTAPSDDVAPPVEGRCMFAR